MDGGISEGREREWETGWLTLFALFLNDYILFAIAQKR